MWNGYCVPRETFVTIFDGIVRGTVLIYGRTNQALYRKQPSLAPS